MYRYGIETTVKLGLTLPLQGVLIVPLWNWNKDMFTGILPSSQCLNCTVMELKLRNRNSAYLIYSVLIVPLWNWNYIKAGLSPAAFIVLIVPLWNWNWFIATVWYCDPGLNCTVMELKPEFYFFEDWLTSSLNCTVMELKHDWMIVE